MVGGGWAHVPRRESSPPTGRLPDDDDSDWTTGCGNGDEVVTDQLPDGATAKYLPMVTKAAPQGWTRLSDFVFVM